MGEGELKKQIKRCFYGASISPKTPLDKNIMVIVDEAKKDFPEKHKLTIFHHETHQPYSITGYPCDYIEKWYKKWFGSEP